MKTGDKYRDWEGDTWTVQDDGTLMWDESAGYGEPLFQSLSDLQVGYGPLVPVRQPALPASPPDYYQFPGGVQVIDISRHLTSNAGQAVQYLARSSRIDGVNKDDPVRDLMKARDMIDDELARLGAVS